jgi:anti-sigma-K factor RskA
MSTSIHPSSDDLSAYFDHELSDTEAASVATHLADCPDCRSHIEAFAVLAELGPRVEEMLPGDTYWTDLPDRVLTRLAMDPEDVGAPAVAKGSSFWRNLWNPEGAWRWAVGSTAAAVLLVGAWFTIHQAQNPAAPIGQTVAESTPAPAEVPAPGTGLAGTPLMSGNSRGADLAQVVNNETDAGPEMSPDAFSRRVIMTLGGRNDLGQSLDIASGQAVAGGGAASPIADQVSWTLPALGPQARLETQGVVSCGPGESPLEKAFVCAAKADEMGQSDLAREGYQVVQRFSNQSLPIYWEADYRLTYHRWRQRLASVPAGPQRAQVLSQMQQLADRSYKSWKKTGSVPDCREAWCMNRAFFRLAAEVSGVGSSAEQNKRMTDLVRCMDQ